MGTKSSSLRSNHYIERRPNIQRRPSDCQESNIRNQDDEIMQQYNQIVQRHELIETLKKSKKQQVFFLKKYHIIKLENSDLFLQDECPICLENLMIGDNIYLIPCCHYFHKKCLKDWILIENDCPSCRMKLGKNTADEIDMCLFTREEKVIEAKLRYLSNLDLNKLEDILIKNNIDKTELDKDKIIKKLMKLNNLFQEEIIIDEGLTESDNSSESINSNNSSSESINSNNSSSESMNSNNSSSESMNSNNSSSESMNSNESIKIRYVNRKS